MAEVVKGEVFGERDIRLVFAKRVRASCRCLQAHKIRETVVCNVYFVSVIAGS